MSDNTGKSRRVNACGKIVKHMVRDHADRFAVALCLVFIGLGSLWVGELGIQNDEALFSAGIYPPTVDWAMVMTYVGTLKSYVFTPIFHVWRPSAASVRVPAVFLGGLTILVVLRSGASDDRNQSGFGWNRVARDRHNVSYYHSV